MSVNFQRQVDLPQVNVTRQMFYDLIESLVPMAAVTDEDSLTVLNGKLLAALAVPRWRKYTVGFADLALDEATKDVELFPLPAGGVVHAVKLKHSEKFEGGAISAYTVSVGIEGDLARYADPFDVFQAVDNTAFALEDAELAGETHASGGTMVRAAAEATGADLDAATQGSLDVWVLWSVTEGGNKNEENHR